MGKLFRRYGGADTAVMSSFEELLERDGQLVYKTRGVSMLPMLHENQDLVIIAAKKSRLKKYDVALYRRGKSYVLHRVIAVNDGYYTIRGDNTYRLEFVPEEAVLGVLTGFVRKGKQHRDTDVGYRLYVRFWCAIYPLRSCYVRLRGRALRMASRILPDKWKQFLKRHLRH